ncbi:ROK family protein [Rhizobium sp. KVB221]|uniref:ROK family protein n=1 Tax=Rhizobium setariae TaxID=2801340 RepID=A0A936YV56_9HYPH|nr:ROK family protein [Rhizobium setariae]MBL0373380.1 ROK family protein [Rhizobium setariae]
MSAVLSFDLGGTNLRAGLAKAGDVVAPVSLGHWPAPQDLAEFRARICGLIEEHAASRIGIAIPGLASGTRCVWVPNLPYLDSVDLASLLPDIVIALGNDAQMALLAEAALGVARGLSDAILLAIGTGIGSAVLADGRIVRGHSGGATSFGWASAATDDPGDEVHGWLERVASGRAMDALARQAGLANGAALVSRARGGDESALAALEGPATALGTALAGAVALLGSRSVIISGGVADSLDVLASPLLAAMRRNLPPHLRDIQLLAGGFGPRASLIGAAIAAQGSPLWKEIST